MTELWIVTLFVLSGAALFMACVAVRGIAVRIMEMRK